MNILGICGKLQSGKSSSCNFLSGYTLKQKGIISTFSLDNEGRLIVPNYTDVNGERVIGEGILDVTRMDWQFAEYAKHNIWPHVKVYSLAEPIKIILMEVFGLTQEQCFGTNEQKNAQTKTKWGDLTHVLSKYKLDKLKQSAKFPDFITGREFMQIFGTEICRKIDNDCWIRACINRIVSESSELALISDVRFENEINYIKETGGKVILLTRKIQEDTHASEVEIDSVDKSKFDYIIDNRECSIDTKNKELLVALGQFGWL